MINFARRAVDLLAHRIAYILSRKGQDAQLELLGRLLSKQNASLTEIQHLSDVEFKVYSQWGEDGIIDWLVSKLPGIPEKFIEFGVEDYYESNTRFLMMHRNWRGMVMDGSEKNMRVCQNSHYYWRYGLKAVTAFITAENINALITEHGFGGEIGILSVDIDGNDYWVWKQIEAASPWIVIAEYNAVLGDLYPITIPYQPNFSRLQGHYSGQYFGSSIMALELCASEKGYTLIGSNLVGNNAFFVRNDLLSNFSGVKDKRAKPSRFRDARDEGGLLTFTEGMDRIKLIRECKVVNVSTGESHKLGDFDKIYSDYWMSLIN